MYIRELRVSYRTRKGRGPCLPSQIESASQAAAAFAAILEREVVEVCGLLCLSSCRQVLAYYELSRGTLDSALIHARDVFRNALLANAAAVIIGHNHPSGDPSPSADDIAVTRRLSRAGEVIGIPLLDHIVVGMHAHVSLWGSRSDLNLVRLPPHTASYCSLLPNKGASMPDDRRRIVEVRLIVLAFVDITDATLTEAVAASGGETVAGIVSAEVTSNLESVPYVESVTTSQL